MSKQLSAREQGESRSPRGLNWSTGQDGSNLNNAKWVAVFLILVVTLGAGLVPIMASNRRSGSLITKNIRDLGDCFTAGIFIAMGLCHLVTEAAHDEVEWGSTVPFAGKLHVHLFMAMFAVIFGIECMTSKQRSCQSSHKSHSHTDLIELQALEPFQEGQLRRKPHTYSKFKPQSLRKVSVSELEEPMNPDEQEPDVNHAVKSKRRRSSAENSSIALSLMHPTSSERQVGEAKLKPDIHLDNIKRDSQLGRTGSESVLSHNHPELARPVQTTKEPQSSSAASLLLILFAVSIHSLSTGLALGVQSETNTCMSILIGRLVDDVAVIAHKWAETIAVMLNLIQVLKDIHRQLLILLLYSLAAPFGIILG